jgi:hypothetical protein
VDFSSSFYTSFIPLGGYIEAVHYIGNGYRLSPRFGDLLWTPLFMSLILFAAAQTFNPIAIAALVTGMLVYTAAQAPGWGRQMDLGRDAGRDDEWGWQIRDMIFGKEPPILDENGVQKIDWKNRPMHQGNFWRDLTGLYMRFGWFLLVIPFWWFFHPFAIAIPILTFLLSPLVWVVEYKKFNKYGYGSPHSGEAAPIGTSWVEFWISAKLTVITLLTAAAIALV